MPDASVSGDAIVGFPGQPLRLPPPACAVPLVPYSSSCLMFDVILVVYAPHKVKAPKTADPGQLPSKLMLV